MALRRPRKGMKVRLGWAAWMERLVGRVILRVAETV